MQRSRPIRILLILVCLSATAAALLPQTLFAQSIEFDRYRGERILQYVSGDVRKNYYDPNLKGLDWKKLEAEARDRIRRANSDGEIFSAIMWLLEHLNDSHTRFTPPLRATKYEFGFKAKPYGEEIRIFEVKEKGAAEKAGLLLGDRIISVADFKAQRQTFDKLMFVLQSLYNPQALEMVVERPGQPPKKVRVEGTVKEGLLPFYKDGKVSINDINRINEQMIKERGRPFSKVEPDGIGYVRVPHFMLDDAALSSVFGDVDKCRAMVIDLRDNGGGYVFTLLASLGYFVDEPVELALTQHRKKTSVERVRPSSPKLRMPVTVLVDSTSASAAEIFARFLQKTKKATVVGDRTSGRVNTSRSFQHEVGYDNAVVLWTSVTVARLTFPDGEELEGRGVQPDVTCNPTPDDMREKRDPCLQLAKDLLRDSLGLPLDPSPVQR